MKKANTVNTSDAPMVMDGIYVYLPNFTSDWSLAAA